MKIGANESLEDFAERFRAAHPDAPLGPLATKVRTDNERVRIWELNLEPGEASYLHRHDLDYMVILIEGDRIAGIPGPESTRTPRAADVVPGMISYLTRGETEWAVNIGNKPYRELLIELKD